MNDLVILTGPTAVGKTSLSINLAKVINGEIISADSMQVYKGMDVGTAKISVDEMKGIKHHLIDVISPKEDFHVVKFQQLAKEAIADIYSRGKIPIICGGTGFYIQAILYDIDFTENEIDKDYRRSLEDFAKESGVDALHDKLKEIDEESAASIPAANVKRVIRAIEYFNQTGEKFSTHNAMQKQKTSPFNYAYFVLNDDRALLYNRIDSRVDSMIEAGLISEVKSLIDMGVKCESTAMEAIGYKEIYGALTGQMSMDEAVELIKKNSRNYAKRQLTWFRREKDVTWLDRTCLKSDDEILSYMLSILKEKGII